MNKNDYTDLNDSKSWDTWNLPENSITVPMPPVKTLESDKVDKLIEEVKELKEEIRRMQNPIIIYPSPFQPYQPYESPTYPWQPAYPQYPQITRIYCTTTIVDGNT